MLLASLTGVVFAAAAPGAQAGVYYNTSTITIPTSGSATPYPSPVTVTGLAGPVVDVNVQLTGFSHGAPDDVGVVLVGPGGQALVLMDGAGDTTDASALDFSIDDSAATQFPDSGALAGGSFKPTNYTADSFSPPGPGTSYGNPGPISGGTATLASTFNGTNPNGNWNLYVQDFSFSPLNSGQFSGGWRLQVTTGVLANPGSLGAIPDGTTMNPCTDFNSVGAPRDVTFDVSGLSGTVSNVAVEFAFSPPHAFAGDVDVQLLAPGGAPAHTIFNRTNAVDSTDNGELSDLVGPYAFFDTAQTQGMRTWWTSGALVGPTTPIPADSYRASSAGGAPGGGANTLINPTFAGVAPNGTWTLRFRDRCAPDTGSVSAAALGIDTVPAAGGGGTVANPPAASPTTPAPAAKKCKKKGKKGASAAKKCKKKKR
jgi:subtilisin-like proprotein convertase family protein